MLLHCDGPSFFVQLIKTIETIRQKRATQCTRPFSVILCASAVWRYLCWLGFKVQSSYVSDAVLAKAIISADVNCIPFGQRCVL